MQANDGAKNIAVGSTIAVIAEEGAASLYGGLSAHLMRVIPNAAVMFFIYEAVLRWES